MINLKDGDQILEVEGDLNGYVDVCECVANKTRPVLLMEMQMPYDSKHSGWMAICNTEPCDGEYQNMPIQELLTYEPSLQEFINDYQTLPMFVRGDKDSPWEKV